jgi:methionine synthase II (cobalamin-independent)
MEITAEIQIEDLIQQLPEAVRILARHGIVCIRCGEPYWGTLRELASEKGITDLEPVLAELRAAAQGAQ